MARRSASLHLMIYTCIRRSLPDRRLDSGRHLLVSQPKCAHCQISGLDSFYFHTMLEGILHFAVFQ